MKAIDIIGVASGRGARDSRCELGPEALMKFGLAGLVRQAGAVVNWLDTLHPAPLSVDETQQVAALGTRLAHRVRHVMAAHRLPVVIGGDHAHAVGTWTGMRQALPPNARIGLIWVDAHMDSHTPETTPSGAIHGMPLACLLGFGDARLTTLGGITPKFLPQHVCVIGVRSYEPQEAELLKQLGVRVIMMDEIRRRGLRETWQEASRIACNGTAGYGISIDLDAIDPQDAPGVGTPVEGGIHGADLMEALCMAQGDPLLLGLEIMEYNPMLDQSQKTAHLIKDIIATLTVGSYCHEPHHRPRTSVLCA